MSARLLGSIVIGMLASAPLVAQSDAQHFGKVAFANSGSKAAQPAFLRGLALLHNFQYLEAADAFHEAEKIDPTFAMAYWGEAMTYNHGVWTEQDSVAGRATLAKIGATSTERLAKTTTARERAFLASLAVLYATTGTKLSRDSAFATAMEHLAAQYPRDVDAQLFYAVSLMGLPRVDSTYAHAGAIAALVMREHPEHPGALHYLIHAYDDPAHATMAMSAARAYSTIAANAPHAQHMVSHIFVALGMWNDVVKANEISVHMHDTPAAVVVAECGHAGAWLHYAYLQQGRLGDAGKMMNDCRAHSTDAPVIARGFAQMRLFEVVDGGQAVADLPTLPDSMARAPVTRFFLAYANAYDALRRHDTATARVAIDQMAMGRAALVQNPRRAGPEPMLDITGVAIDEMRALAQFSGGDREGGIAALRAATEREQAMTFMFGPPAVEKPARELLADALLEMRRGAEARVEYTKALERTPERSLALLGLARANAIMGDSAAARSAYTRLATNWHRADAGTGALKEARQWAPALTGVEAQGKATPTKH